MALQALQEYYKKIQVEEEVKTLLGDLLTKIRLQNVLVCHCYLLKYITGTTYASVSGI